MTQSKSQTGNNQGNHQTETTHEKWYLVSELGDFDKNSLIMLFQSCIQLYTAHVNWFLQHRDSGFRNFGILITGEITFYALSNNIFGIYPLLLISITFFALGVLLRMTAANSCEKSFKAALNYLATINKTAVALGFTTPVKIPKILQKIIYPHDDTIWPPEYTRQLPNETKDNNTDPKSKEHPNNLKKVSNLNDLNSTQLIFDEYKKASNTTLYQAKLTLLICSIASIAIPVIICVDKFNLLPHP